MWGLSGFSSEKKIAALRKKEKLKRRVEFTYVAKKGQAFQMREN